MNKAIVNIIKTVTILTCISLIVIPIYLIKDTVNNTYNGRYYKDYYYRKLDIINKICKTNFTVEEVYLIHDNLDITKCIYENK